MNSQSNIFDYLYPTFKINKPIRLITLFSGYDSQALALKYLGVDFELYKTCEWATKSIQALKDLHFENDNNDYSRELTIEEVKNFLFKKGISANYNDPMTEQQINRLNENQARTIYNNIKATRNLVNIQQVKGEDLCIKDIDKFTYLLTYSFPCQDLSLAGKGKGMSDTSTRSGMLWEVERILTECKEKPQILLMENVPQVHSQDNIEDFNKWQYSLEKMGYKNYWQDLIATDYGIPQTRNRCFMVSILGDYNYTFPKKIPLKLRLKDMLEEKVDEKYYLSNKMLEYIVSKDDKYKVDENKLVINREIACSKTTREGNTRADTTDYICNDLPENTNILKIKNNNKKGYLEAQDGDCIDLCHPKSKTRRGRVQKEKSQTITTMAGEHLGVVETNNYIQWKQKGRLDIDCRAYFEEKVAPTTTTTPKTKIINNLRIRKLTPKECFRLMGVKDEDYDKVAKKQSNASLYHLAGDSIVVNVLMAIFKNMLGSDKE